MWLNVRKDNEDIDSRSFDHGELVVGRDEGCDLVIDDERASRRHARLSALAAGRLQVEDIGSTNGTFVNGRRITGPTTVRPGDELRIGRHVLRLASEARPPGTATVMGSPDEPPVDAPHLRVAAPDEKPGASGTPGVADERSPGRRLLGSRLLGSRLLHGRLLGSRRGLAGVTGGAIVVVALIIALLATRLGQSSALSPQQLAGAWGPSTLFVLADVGGQTQDSGSAWVYNAPQGLLVTNAHVVDGGTSYTVGEAPNQQKAQLVAASPCDDLAVLKVFDTAGLRTFRLAQQDQVKQGEEVTALGYPGNSASTPNLSVTSGVVSVTQTRFDVASLDAPHYPDVVQTDAPINPGNSGGPLLDNHGRLIGIDTAGITTQGGDIIQGEGYAIGLGRAEPVLAQLAQGHSTGFTGMNFIFPSQASDFTDLGLPVVPGGIIIPSADPNSPALNAGFGVDGPVVITAINGQPLNGTLASYCQQVGGYQAGQTATFSVEFANGSLGSAVVGFE